MLHALVKCVTESDVRVYLCVCVSLIHLLPGHTRIGVNVCVCVCMLKDIRLRVNDGSDRMMHKSMAAL